MKGGIGGICSTHGEMINSYKILVGKSEEKRILGVGSKILSKWILRRN
jgi:hypothetical protein